MTYTPSADQIINIEGPPHETLFWHLKSWLIVEHTDELQRQIDEMWNHYGDIKDHRLLALVGALCVEDSLDYLLYSLVPGYLNLLETTDFTCSMKIKMTRAMRLIPARILGSCDPIRKIRNAFVHGLNTYMFRQLDGRLLQKLAPHVLEFNIAPRNESDHAKLYRDLVGFCTIALRGYGQQVKALRSYLETDNFWRHFKDYTEEHAESSPDGS
jgi:hypothetical protein